MCIRDRFKSHSVVLNYFAQTCLKGNCARYSKVPKTFRDRKAIRKTPTCLFCNACLSYAVNRIKIKVTVKFHASRRLRFEGTKNYVARKVSGLSRNRPLGRSDEYVVIVSWFCLLAMICWNNTLPQKQWKCWSWSKLNTSVSIGTCHLKAKGHL